MERVNSDAEILEFAVSKEVEAYHFYLALARRVDSQKIRDVLENLAIEELEHKKRLELEIMKLGRTVTSAPGAARPDSDYILSDSNRPLDMDDRDVLLLAMEKEEAAFRTYVNMLPNVHDEESREMLLALAEEEVKHKLRFEAEYDELLSGA
jgi:rubrerythrin